MLKITIQLALIASTFLSTMTQASLSTGLINDFQTGTVQSWGHPQNSAFIPEIKADDGPSGAGDFSLRVKSSGASGPGSKLLAVNTSSDYTGAADAIIDSLLIDLKLISTNDLNIRIAIGSGASWYTSNTAHTLSSANVGNWENALFSFSDLIQTAGTDSLLDVLGNITEVRILHNNILDHRGAKVNAEFAVDNISAVPLPATAWLFISGLGLLGLRRRK